MTTAPVEIGREPRSPWRLAPREWVDVLKRSLQSFLADDTWTTLGDPTKAPDGYTAFATGRQNFVNMGLLDSQAITDYARAQDAARGAVAPDFGKNGVPVTDAPASVEAGQAVGLTLGDLVVDSDGAPAATAVDVAFRTAEGTETGLGTVAVPAGSETVTLSGITATAASRATALNTVPNQKAACSPPCSAISPLTG